MPKSKKRRALMQEIKNEKYKAAREYDFAAPGSTEERVAKAKYITLSRIERRKKAQSTDSNN